VQAIVMAAGEGRRLRPVTEHWPKPILPIDGRAVIATLIRRLTEEGLTPVTVVTGHLAEQVEVLLGGLDVRVVRQPEADGSADAVRRALAGGAVLPALVSAADSVFHPGDLTRFRDAFAASGAAGAVAFFRGPTHAAIRVEDGLVTRVVDSAGDLTPAALWGLTDEIDLDDLPGPPFELAAAFQRAVDAGKPIAGVEVGRTRHLTNPVDLVRENFPYLGDGPGPRARDSRKVLRTFRD
jgi:CTP:molybdopterin cytidylyltransferase MocA